MPNDFSGKNMHKHCPLAVTWKVLWSLKLVLCKEAIVFIWSKDVIVIFSH